MGPAMPRRTPDGPQGAEGPVLSRRAALLALGALPLAAAACARGGQEPSMAPEAAAPPARGSRMPVIFAAHGAPVLLDDPVWVGELAAWAAAMPRPESILMVS